MPILYAASRQAVLTHFQATGGIWIDCTATTTTTTTTAPCWIDPTTTTYVYLSGSPATNTVAWAVPTGTLTWAGNDWSARPELYVPRAPAIIRARSPSDRERYDRAIAEHDTQEAERIARRIARDAEIVQRARDDAVARDLARDRARELLIEHLSPAQRETFAQNGWFVVEGGRSKKQYRIHGDSVAGNICEMSGQQVTHRLCCHADGKIPVGDHLLAQKIMLELAEDDFLRIANRNSCR